MSTNNSDVFTPLIRSAWLQKIEKDLRGKSLDDLDLVLGDSIRISPFQHIEDLPKDEEIHLAFNREKHRIPGVMLSSSSFKDVDNSLIIKTLNHGAGSIFLDGLEDSGILDNVDTSMVDIYFASGSMAGPSSSIATLITRVNLTHYDAFKTSFLNRLTSKEIKDRSHHTFVLRLGDNFYLNLCGLRALHLIMRQINEDLGKKEYKVWACSTPGQELDLASGLLRSMSHYVAGFLGGADHLSTEGLDDEESLRLHLNNAHLLCLESKMAENKDLVSGSFFLDKLTWAIAEDLWASLQRRFES